MSIIDCVAYNGERELFEIRYNILKDYVDEFIVVEFDKTFSGRQKERLFNQHYPKVKYFYHTDIIYGKYKKLAEASPNTQGADHWKLEFMQKESIKDALIHLNDDDVVLIGDCDEIWNPDVLTELPHSKLKLKVYTYYLNNRSSELFWGTLFTHYKYIKNDCLNDTRTNTPATTKDFGWHFTSMHHQVEQKLLDSYTEESYARPEVMDNLAENVKQNKDFLGRNFTYKVDESEWPPWLKIHRQEFAHLLK